MFDIQLFSTKHNLRLHEITFQCTMPLAAWLHLKVKTETTRLTQGSVHLTTPQNKVRVLKASNSLVARKNTF